MLVGVSDTPHLSYFEFLWRIYYKEVTVISSAALTKLSYILVPPQPDPPIVGKVTYHTIDFYWHPLTPANNDDEQDKEEIIYCIQEQDIEKNGAFITVYE